MIVREQFYAWNTVRKAENMFIMVVPGLSKKPKYKSLITNDQSYFEQNIAVKAN